MRREGALIGGFIWDAIFSGNEGVAWIGSIIGGEAAGPRRIPTITLTSPIPVAVADPIVLGLQTFTGPAALSPARAGGL
jgi:hypothetical protein